MSKLKDLVGLFFKERTGITELLVTSRKGSSWPLVLNVLKFLGTLSLIFLLIGVSVLIVFLSSLAGAIEVGAKLGVLIYTVIVIFVTVPLMLNDFLKDRSVFLLLAMPFKISDILLAKILSIYCINLIISVCFLGPLFIGLTIVGGGGLLLFKGIVVLCLAPLLPISVLGFVVLLLKALSAKQGVKTLLSVLGFLLIMVFSMSFAFIGPVLEETLQGNFVLQAMLDSINGALNMTGIYYLYGKVLFESLNVFLIFILGSLGSLAAFVLLGSKIYLKLLTNRVSKVKITSKIVTGDLEKGVTNKFKALLKWDFQYLYKEPLFLIYSIVTIVVLPVFLFFVFSITLKQPEMQTVEFTDLIYNGIRSYPEIVVLILISVGAFFSASNVLTYSSFSMEGKYLFIKKLLPMPGYLFYWSKIIIASIFSLGILGMVLVGGVFLRLPLFHLFNLTILTLIFLVALNCLGAYIDGWKPYLTWTTPRMCMKKNMNALLMLLIMLVFMGFLIMLGLGVKLLLGLDGILFYIPFYLLGIGILVAFYYVIRKTANRMIAKINI